MTNDIETTNNTFGLIFHPDCILANFFLPPKTCLESFFWSHESLYFASSLGLSAFSIEAGNGSAEGPFFSSLLFNHRMTICRKDNVPNIRSANSIVTISQSIKLTDSQFGSSSLQSYLSLLVSFSPRTRSLTNYLTIVEIISDCCPGDQLPNSNS